MADERAPHVHPTLDDPVVTGLSEVVGGPMGTRARPHRWWTPLRVLLLLTAFTFALGTDDHGVVVFVRLTFFCLFAHG